MLFSLPIAFWIVVFVLMVVILVLQDATQYDAPDWFADLLDDVGLYVIAIVLLVGIAFRLKHYQHSPYLFWRGIVLVSDGVVGLVDFLPRRLLGTTQEVSPPASMLTQSVRALAHR
jgi:uncharacterized membrane-anchored protein